MRLLDWFIEPFVEGTELEKKEENKIVEKEELDDEDYFIIDEEELEAKDEMDEEQNLIFRPQSFTQYIGQESAKEILKISLEGTKKRNLVFPHTLIHGSAGLGKTTLGKIIANNLDVKIIETISSDVSDFEQLKKYINECDGGILFLDEIHGIDRSTAEKLYSIMEDFKYNGKRIKPFTVIGATTEIGEILKTRRPFYERFKNIISLVDYNVDDLIKIIIQYKQKTFPDDKIKGETYKIIAKNSRNTPRTALRLLDATVHAEGDVNRVLKSFSIIKDGYTVQDYSLLKYFYDSKCTLGLQGIATFLNTSEYNYLYDIEPYLIKNEDIVRTPRGRTLTDKGIKTINKLKKE